MVGNKILAIAVDSYFFFPCKSGCPVFVLPSTTATTATTTTTTQLSQ
ncbi:hypothetical protein PP707_00885 [Acetobacter pasteurianus]|nr:hypothetical protein [Acetobacter pasteurianus]